MGHRGNMVSDEYANIWGGGREGGRGQWLLGPNTK